MKLEMRKALDVQWGIPKMPDDVRKFFFRQYDHVSNDVWVEYVVGMSSNYDYGENDEIIIIM